MTRFIKIKVEDAPFLVEKLQVKVLPCVISFTDGIAVDRYVPQAFVLSNPLHGNGHGT